jgi:hypothetical protein
MLIAPDLVIGYWFGLAKRQERFTPIEEVA